MEELGALVRAVTHGEMSAGAALREVEVLARGKQRKMMQEGAGASLALEAARVRRGAERWKAEADSWALVWHLLDTTTSAKGSAAAKRRARRRKYRRNAKQGDGEIQDVDVRALSVAERIEDYLSRRERGQRLLSTIGGGVEEEEEEEEEAMMMATDADAAKVLGWKVSRIVSWCEWCSDIELRESEEGVGGASVGVVPGWLTRLSSAEGVWRETHSKVRVERMQRARMEEEEEEGRQIVFRPPIEQKQQRYDDHLVRELDPDAPGRQHGRSVAAENEQAELRICAAMFKLVRSGRLADAVQLCRDAGQPWRAASLAGGGKDGPCPLGFVREMVGGDDMSDDDDGGGIGAWEEEDIRMDMDGGDANGGFDADGVLVPRIDGEQEFNDTMHVDDEIVDDEAVRLARFEDAACDEEADEMGFQHRALWRLACGAVAEAASSGDAPYSIAEAAVYGSVSGRSDLVIPFCRSWEDECWTYFRCWLDVMLDDQITGIVSPPESMDAEYAWPPRELRRMMPTDVSEVFAKMRSSENADVRSACEDAFRSLQELMILENVPLLLRTLCDWVFADEYATSGPPAFLISFAAHYVLMLQWLLPGGDQLLGKHGGYSDEANIANTILFAYVSHLIDVDQIDLVPVYARNLRDEPLIRAYGLLFEKLMDAPLDAKAHVVSEASRYLPMEDGGGSVVAIIESAIKEVRESRGLAVRGGPELRLKAVEWMCADTELVRYGLSSACTLCRELSCATAVALCAPTSADVRIIAKEHGDCLARSLRVAAEAGTAARSALEAAGSGTSLVLAELELLLGLSSASTALLRWREFWTQLGGHDGQWSEMPDNWATLVEDAVFAVDTVVSLLRRRNAVDIFVRRHARRQEHGDGDGRQESHARGGAGPEAGVEEADVELQHECIQVAGVVVAADGVGESRVYADSFQASLVGDCDGRGIGVEVYPRQDGALQITLRASGTEAASIAARALARNLASESRGFIVTYADATDDALMLETMWQLCVPSLALAAVDAAHAILAMSRRVSTATIDQQQQRRQQQQTLQSTMLGSFAHLATGIASDAVFAMFQPYHLARVLHLEREMNLARMEMTPSSLQHPTTTPTISIGVDM